MFVMTHSGRIVNLARHRTICVTQIHGREGYHVVAYIDSMQGKQIDGHDLDIIATFEDEEAATTTLRKLVEDLNRS